MNTQFQRSMLLPTITNCALTLAGRNVFGLGGDYSNGQTVNQPAWPVGMADLVNTKSRVGGMFVSAEDIFFYSGTTQEFNAFLDGYSKIQDIERHRLVLHRGAGETDSVVGGNKRPCDWKLQGRRGASHPGFQPGKPSRAPAYVLEIHFWTEGRIALHELVIPINIEVLNAKLNART